MKFDIVKSGYDINQVNSYIYKEQLSYNTQLESQKQRIEQLLRENEGLKARLCEYTSKETDISNALIFASSKAKEIENQTQIYSNVELNRLRLLYKKFNALLEELVKNNASISTINYTKALINEFQNAIAVETEKYNQSIKTGQTLDPMKKLLNKMNNYIAKRNQPFTQSNETEYTINQFNDDEDVNFKCNSPTQIKPICDLELNENENFENLVDKFLQDDTEPQNALTSKLGVVDANGFDLKEAVNPTQTLDEIMKAFDFFDEE